jgi:3-deoxy-D-manno-octulosonic acid kinase
VELPGGERVVVRRYLRGGLMRRLNRERYFAGHRAFDELRVTEHAAAAGVRVPVVLAAVERRAGIAYTASLATRWIAGGEELAGWLAGKEPATVAAALLDAGRQLALMHDAGIAHPDMNLRNLLVVGDAPDVYVLDFDRARLLPRPVPRPLRARGLLRLARSARKLRAPIDSAGWAALRDGYGPAWPLSDALG